MSKCKNESNFINKNEHLQLSKLPVLKGGTIKFNWSKLNKNEQPLKKKEDNQND
jgi:hypothetical protein